MTRQQQSQYMNIWFYGTPFFKFFLFAESGFYSEFGQLFGFDSGRDFLWHLFRIGWVGFGYMFYIRPESVFEPRDLR